MSRKIKTLSLQEVNFFVTIVSYCYELNRVDYKVSALANDRVYCKCVIFGRPWWVACTKMCGKVSSNRIGPVYSNETWLHLKSGNKMHKGAFYWQRKTDLGSPHSQLKIGMCVKTRLYICVLLCRHGSLPTNLVLAVFRQRALYKRALVRRFGYIWWF